MLELKVLEMKRNQQYFQIRWKAEKCGVLEKVEEMFHEEKMKTGLNAEARLKDWEVTWDWSVWTSWVTLTRQL